jgi:decaprenylphospho-beta-D-erythro-pentofuranosid-2-ulose 2-reductase
MKKKGFSKIVLIGSTSEIGLSILTQISISENAHLVLVGRSRPLTIPNNLRFQDIEFVYLDLSSPSAFVKYCEGWLSSDESCPDLVIFAAAQLPLESTELVTQDLQNKLIINGVSQICLLSTFASKMVAQNSGSLIILSSVVVLRPRIKNYSYGASKIALDYFAIGLSRKLRKGNVNIKVIRPGFVFTKLSQNHSPAPFAISPLQVGKLVSKSLFNKSVIIYAPRKLRWVMGILRILPRPLFDKL